MTQTHPITPPPELVQQWLMERPKGEYVHTYMTTQAAQWGADHELEACVNWLADPCTADMPSLASDLRYSRRPKAPTFKEQAMLVLVEHGSNLDGRMELDAADIDTIRRALEALDD